MMSGGNDAESGPRQSESMALKPDSGVQRDAPDNTPELDEFGLPQRPPSRRRPAVDSGDEEDTFHDAEDPSMRKSSDEQDGRTNGEARNSGRDQHTMAQQSQETNTSSQDGDSDVTSTGPNSSDDSLQIPRVVKAGSDSKDEESSQPHTQPLTAPSEPNPESQDSRPGTPDAKSTSPSDHRDITGSPIRKRESRAGVPAVSEWSHQRLAPQSPRSGDEEEEVVEWQAMPALGEYDIYDDNGRIVAKASKTTDNGDAYSGIGGAGKGYTRIQLDEDAESATSMDEDTQYLFQNDQKDKPAEEEEEFWQDEDQRDALTQLQTTKNLLTEGQRIAYVGVVRLTAHKMLRALQDMERTKGTEKQISKALESMEMWTQKMMVRLYGHMDINSAEQVMIEQLAEHGVQPSDLVPPLMHNARVTNPMASREESEKSRPATASERSSTAEEPSLKEADDSDGVPEVHTPEDMPHTKDIDLDLRWTVLCDLFLVLISDSDYDSRSRRLLERVASSMQITWVHLCRFEKRVIDALEMQEDEAKENWNETENLEKRRKLGLKRKYVMMGLATVGGGLVIGLSAGLLAPVIGLGLAAGFTTIGVTGTAGFLGGVGGAALITSAATAAGGTIAVRASQRRMGHVKTFEYRPLHNNKRLNLILTVSGWMSGKVDDVRLPFSTVDPIMGDIYSLLWEPEMLRSTGDTVNILATEALTQTVQQVLGSTILVALMASIQLPIVLSKLAYLIDNPWSVSLTRATAAGLILADSLIGHHLGRRPITLVGFSLGSRLIFSCLQELSRKGAYGLVQNVYLFGSPIVAKKDDYLRARSVISGRFLNGYASNDWILGYLFRATSGGIMRVAGLAPVEDIPGLENVNVSQFVSGHMAYRTAMPRLLREVGWEVESDEFTEIEDPDPENHAQRQRELILEIDEARKKAEEKPEKKIFGLFKKGKLAEKRGWETYNVDKGVNRNESKDSFESSGLEANVLFDIDAIRKELESEMIEVRELDTTLPPMQITSIKNGEKHVEYLRLPPDIKPEEVAKMKLPPRPDEIEVSFPPQPTRPSFGKRVSSLLPTPRVTRPSPSHSPSPNRLSEREGSGFEGPRELVTTLPPLAISPSVSSDRLESTTSRPGLAVHSTEPDEFSWNHPQLGYGDNLTSPIEALSFERNAWADDDDDDLGKEREIKMTFE